MKIDWKRKLSSRKLWVAVAGFVSGLILAFGGAESTAATVSGCILQGASVIGYLLAEGLTDAEGVKNTSSTVTMGKDAITAKVFRMPDFLYKKEEELEGVRDYGVGDMPGDPGCGGDDPGPLGPSADDSNG